MIDFDIKVRKVARIIGTSVGVTLMEGEPHGLFTKDGPRTFYTVLGTPSDWERSLSVHHEGIYRARGKVKFEQQKGLCALCGRPMKGTENTEIDHIESRGAHGRDDSLSNLRVVHGEPCHRERHNPTIRRSR